MSAISLPLDQEKQLVAAAQADREQFAPLYEHYFPHIRRFFAVKLSDSALIDDLTARTFEKALAALDRFEFRGYSFSAWLYRIAINLYNDHFRREGRRNTIPLDDEFADKIPDDTADAAHEELVRREQGALLKQLVEELPPKQRNIIYWKFYSGLSNKQIAEKANLSETNVSSIIHRAVKLLRDKAR